MQKALTYAHDAVSKALKEMVEGLRQQVGTAPLTGVIGIANGGVPFAHRLALEWQAQTGEKLPVGVLDVVFSRDDVGNKPIPKEVLPTQIPFDVDGATILLADDVLFSGRTARAALEELFQHGRPRRVIFAVLFDRGGHQFPMRADVTGFSEKVPSEQQVKVQIAREPQATDGIYIFTAETL